VPGESNAIVDAAARARLFATGKRERAAAQFLRHDHASTIRRQIRLASAVASPRFPVHLRQMYETSGVVYDEMNARARFLNGVIAAAASARLSVLSALSPSVCSIEARKRACL